MEKLKVEEFKKILASEEGQKAFSEFLKIKKEEPNNEDIKKLKKEDIKESNKDKSSFELMKMIKDIVGEELKSTLKTLQEDNVKKEENKDELDLMKLLKDNQELQRNKDLNKKEENKKQDQAIYDRMARMAKIDPKLFNTEESNQGEK